MTAPSSLNEGDVWDPAALAEKTTALPRKLALGKGARLNSALSSDGDRGGKASPASGDGGVVRPVVGVALGGTGASPRLPTAAIPATPPTNKTPTASRTWIRRRLRREITGRCRPT